MKRMGPRIPRSSPGAYAIDDFDYNKPGTPLLKVSPKERNTQECRVRDL